MLAPELVNEEEVHFVFDFEKAGLDSRVKLQRSVRSHKVSESESIVDESS